MRTKMEKSAHKHTETHTYTETQQAPQIQKNKNKINRARHCDIKGYCNN